MTTSCWRSAFGGLVFLAALASASAATYTVGEAQGWQAGVDYAAWAAQYKFNVGDVLVFSYSPMHGVLEVSAADYQSCNTARPIKVYTTGQDSVTLTKPSQYFICGVPGHCSNGMALQISAASAAATTPLASPPVPSTTTTAPPPSLLSPPAAITPSPSAPTAPSPASSTPPTAASDSPSLPLLGSPPAPPTVPFRDASPSTMVFASSTMTFAAAAAAVAMVLG